LNDPSTPDRARDDPHSSPFHEDRVTYGTPTRICPSSRSVVADGNLHVRPYNGPSSRWHRAATSQKRGRIRIAGTEHEVTFAPADGTVLDAYRTKCDERQRPAHGGATLPNAWRAKATRLGLQAHTPTSGARTRT
jgi:hypothetical protein